MRNAAAAPRAPATGAQAFHSAACFPRASGAQDLGPLPCAYRTSLSSAQARPSHYEVRGNSSSWRSPPSTMDRRLVRSLRSRRDGHHKKALFARTRRRRHHSSSVMPLSVERSSQPTAAIPACGRRLSRCSTDNSRSFMTHADPAASLLFRLRTLVLCRPPPDRFLLWGFLSNCCIAAA